MSSWYDHIDEHDHESLAIVDEVMKTYKEKEKRDSGREGNR